MSGSNGSVGTIRASVPDGFRMRRMNATVLGFEPALDPVVENELASLDDLLLRSVLPAETPLVELNATLVLPLTPRRSRARADARDIPDAGQFADESLAHHQLSREDLGLEGRSIGGVLDTDAEAATIRYSFQQAIADRWSSLPFNQRSVLAYAGIVDLIVARGRVLRGLTTDDALLSFALDHPLGCATILDYVRVSAARDYVRKHQLQVPDIDEDDGPSATAIRASVTSLSADSFESQAIAGVTTALDDSGPESLIKASQGEPGGLGPSEIPPLLHSSVLQYLKSLSVPLTARNVAFYVRSYLSTAASGPLPATAPSGAPDAFKVTYFVEDATQLQVNTAAVKCASQLFYVMTLGDELGVFDAVRFFTHRYLFSDGFAVEDPTLRRDLENYVFSEQFTGRDDPSSELRVMRCTREPERRSFYRQVFNFGQEPVPGDGHPNTDFARLWKILMLESARFLEKAQLSPNPANYVSRQNVMQAVEDLQYNLSTNCIGMATVITPLMYAELDFVVTRILGHPEVRKHLVPSGGSWWKVVEKLNAGHAARGRASVLHTKARTGYELIRSIADYSPSLFEQDSTFSGFISNVDSFITVQSILQEESARTHGGDGPQGSANGVPGMPSFPGMPQIPGLPSIPGMPDGGGIPGMPTNTASGSSPGIGTAERKPADEWDF
jgi:hypothetical protein